MRRIDGKFDNTRDHTYKSCYHADSGKHGMTESSAERSAELFSKTSEMVPNGLNIPMYES